jgi:hypothetical protein
MRYNCLRWVLLGIISSSYASAQVTYTNYLRQVQLPDGGGTWTWDPSTTVVAAGSQLSKEGIQVAGSRFDLWTIRSAPLTEYLLDSCLVGTSVPRAEIVIDTEDPFGKNLTAGGTLPVNLPGKLRRTRADRPFTVYVTVSNLLNGPTDPLSSKSVDYFRHVQSYGTGVGQGINRTMATRLTQSSITTNGLQTLPYSVTMIPGSPLKKLRGEDRFSVFTITDPTPGSLPPAQLASQYIQVWPVTDGNISGIATNDTVRFAMPPITITYNDIYPDAEVYAQAYKGERVVGKIGARIEGGGKTNTGSSPTNEVLTPTKLDPIFTSDGRWTIELITVSPFGTEYLRHPVTDLPVFVTFTVDRTIEVNSTVTTVE